MFINFHVYKDKSRTKDQALCRVELYKYTSNGHKAHPNSAQLFEDHSNNYTGRDRAHNSQNVQSFYL